MKIVYEKQLTRFWKEGGFQKEKVLCSLLDLCLNLIDLLNRIRSNFDQFFNESPPCKKDIFQRQNFLLIEKQNQNLSGSTNTEQSCQNVIVKDYKPNRTLEETSVTAVIRMQLDGSLNWINFSYHGVIRLTTPEPSRWWKFK